MSISWATPIYLLALYGLVRFVIRDNNEGVKGINWSPMESVGVTLFLYFFGQLLGGLLVYTPLMVAGWSEQRITSWISDNTVGQFITVLLIEAISIGLLLVFLRRRESSLAAIGLKGRPRWSDGGRALLGYVSYFAMYLLVLWAAKALVPSLNLEQKQEIGFDAVTNWQLPLVFISLVVLPPLVEEILMRGFLYAGLKQKLPRLAAVLITSALFAIAHLQAGSSAPLLWVAAIDTFVLSLVLIYLRDKTGRLWAPIFLHALKNGIAFAALFIIAK